MKCESITFHSMFNLIFKMLYRFIIVLIILIFFSSDVAYNFVLIFIYFSYYIVVLYHVSIMVFPYVHPTLLPLDPNVKAVRIVHII